MLMNACYARSMKMLLEHRLEATLEIFTTNTKLTILILF